PKQGHHVSPVGTQQRRIRIIEPGPLRARLEMRPAKMRNAAINRNVDRAANRLDDDVVATVNASVGGRLAHVSLPSDAWPVWSVPYGWIQCLNLRLGRRCSRPRRHSRSARSM